MSTPEEVHAVLDASYRTLLALAQPGVLPLLSTDTVLAIGIATGALSKAKALLGRDIDDGRGKHDQGTRSGPAGA